MRSLALAFAALVPFAPSILAQETGVPPAIEVPADAAAAGTIDRISFEANVAKQPAARLAELIGAWDQLLRNQEAAVRAAQEAEEGTPEREALEKLETDRDSLIEQMTALVDEVKSRDDGVDLGQEPVASAIAHLEAIKKNTEAPEVAVTASEEEKQAAENELLEKVSTVPDDAAKAMELEVRILKAQLRPLSKSQVEKDLQGWLRLLQSQALAIRRVEVSSYKAGAEETARFDARIAALRSERATLISRVEAVIASLERKGGDVTDPRAYIESLTEHVESRDFWSFLAQARASAWLWLRSPEGGIALLLNILKFVGILIAFRFVSAFIGSIMGRALGMMKKSSDLLRTFVVNSTRKVIGFIGLVVALSQLGVDIGPFLAAIGAAGFVIGFALQGTLSNFASGVMLMLYRPYDVGDVVSAAGISGTVDSMNLVSTSIKTFDNQSIIVPNSKIWGDVITNVTANPTRRIDLVFGIAYTDDVDRARELLEEIVNNHELILKDPAPVVRLHQLNDSSVDFVVRPWSRTADYWAVYWDLQRAVKVRFDEAGLSIPFPQRDVHVYQHATPALASAPSHAHGTQVTDSKKVEQGVDVPEG